MDYSPPGSSVHEILQARIQERVSIRIGKEKVKLSFLADDMIIHIENLKSEVAQSCLTLCDPMDYSLQGFSVHGIFQAGVLEWVAISFSRGSSQPRDRTRVSRVVGRRFTL